MIEESTLNEYYYGGVLGESIVFDPFTKEWKSDRQ
jgi:hypothetical protein